MTTVPLRESAPITLDANGNGTARLGPTSHGEVWHVTQASVFVSTSVNQPKVYTYLGDRATQENFADSSFIGANNSSTNVQGDVWMPNAIFANWQGGDVGATATLIVYGTKDVL